jgi:hypothetical protein
MGRRAFGFLERLLLIFILCALYRETDMQSVCVVECNSIWQDRNGFYSGAILIQTIISLYISLMNLSTMRIGRAYQGSKSHYIDDLCLCGSAMIITAGMALKAKLRESPVVPGHGSARCLGCTRETYLGMPKVLSP